jgi:hypothetical protein
VKAVRPPKGLAAAAAAAAAVPQQQPSGGGGGNQLLLMFDGLPPAVTGTHLIRMTRERLAQCWTLRPGLAGTDKATGEALAAAAGAAVFDALRAEVRKSKVAGGSSQKVSAKPGARDVQKKQLAQPLCSTTRSSSTSVSLSSESVPFGPSVAITGAEQHEQDDGGGLWAMDE